MTCLGQVPFGAAAEHGQVAAHRGGEEPAGPGSGEGVGRGPAEPGGEPAVALRCEDGGGLGQPAQLGQRLGQGRAGRVQAADDQPQAGAEPGAAEQGGDHRRAPPRLRSGVVNPEPW